MAGARKLALEVLKQECQLCEERYDGYHLDLARRLLVILRKESENSATIVNDIRYEIEDLGDNLTKKSS